MKQMISFLGLLFIVSFMVSANVINVPADQPSIQAGINAASNGDTVLVADSTYFENINFIGKAITVASHFLMDRDSTHIDNTIIDGSQPSHPDTGSVVLFVSGEDTNSVLCGFTITNGIGTVSSYTGSAIRSGGGIFCNNSGANIKNNKIINNFVFHNAANGGGIGVISTNIVYVNVLDNEIKNNAVDGVGGETFGGGIVFLNASGKINRNIINYNSSYRSNGQANGGGIRLWGDISPTPYVLIKNNKINNNIAESISSPPYLGAVGGGLHIGPTNALVSNNEIKNNSIGSTLSCSGAGIYLDQVTGNTIVESNDISENKTLNGTGLGGGLVASLCTDPLIYNNLISKNSATFGGGIQVRSCTNSDTTLRPAFINNTIINNTAKSSGGGVDIFVSDRIRIMNSIIWGNTAPSSQSIRVFGATSSVYVRYSDVQNTTIWQGIGNINLDPFFSYDSIHISPASPCIDQGIDSLQIGGVWYNAPDSDFEGDPRPLPANSIPDMGADERPKSGIITVPGDFPTIQNGINAATNGDTVQVSQGTYSENINFNGKNIVVGSLTLTTSDTSYISKTIINGDTTGTVVTFENGEDSSALISGFSITKGNYYWTSPCFLIANADPCLKNIIIDGKSSSGLNGGGIVIDSSNSVLDNVVIKNTLNIILMPHGGIGYGGGMSCSEASLTLKNCIINNNVVHGYGGGIYCYNSSLKLENVMISKNTANGYQFGCSFEPGAGGGVYSVGSTINIQNSIFNNNNAHTGAVTISEFSDFYFINTTICNNYNNDYWGSPGYGGRVAGKNSNITMINSIMWNDSQDIEFTFDSSNITIANSDIHNGLDSIQTTGNSSVGWLDGNINSDPLFCDNIFNLADSSRCIGAGIDSIEIGGIWYYTPPLDYDGDPRPTSTGIMPDIGAQESPLDTPIVNISKEENYNNPMTFSLKQNYPNPFNPTTKIKFSIPRNEQVTLYIYNVLGQKVVTLINKKLIPGEYKYVWDASAYASGVYFYKIEAGEYIKTKKLILLK